MTALFKQLLRRSPLGPLYNAFLSPSWNSTNALTGGFQHCVFRHQNSFLPHKINEVQTHNSVNSEEIIMRGSRITADVIKNVNNQIVGRTHGRLFAVVHVCGKQFKVTDEDLIILEGHWEPNVGDQLKLDKVLLVGGTDFTLIGRPLLSPDLVNIQATIVEKTQSQTKTRFRFRKRKQYRRISFYRSDYTLVRINSIQITEEVNSRKDVVGLEGRIF